MKMIKIVPTVGLFSVIIIAAGCSTSKPSGKTYPREYPGRTYPREYPVYNDSYPPGLPPGQAKKVYGSKSARPYAPGQRKKYGNYRRYPLIIIRTPDIRIGRYNDGRYYYRNSEGFMYWKGYDDRFYLDERYMNDLRYDDNEYNDWRYKGRNQYNQKSKKDKWKG